LLLDVIIYIISVGFIYVFWYDEWSSPSTRIQTNFWVNTWFPWVNHYHDYPWERAQISLPW